MPTWDNEPIFINGTQCGTKTYNLADKEQIANCSRECVVRMFLRQKNTLQFVAHLEAIEPQSFYNHLLTISAERIQREFFTVCSEVETYLKNIKKTAGTVKLFIEQGEATVKNAVYNNAFNLREHQIEDMINDIFSVLNELHRTGVVHADIKPDNFLYCMRANVKTLVLNDFDTSFVIPENQSYIQLTQPRKQMLGLTYRYAAPEQYGLYEYKISPKTDVFSAAIVAYIMLNGKSHPTEYHILDGAVDKYDEMKKLFLDMKKEKRDFAECARGCSQLKEVISKALKIKPDDRATALEIAETIQFLQSTMQTKSEPKTEPAEPKKEDKPMDEPKHNQSGNHKGTNIAGQNIHINHGAVIIAIVAIISLAIVVLGLVVLFKFGGGDINMTTNVSVSANLPEDTDKQEISTEYITTLSYTTTTESETDTTPTETEKKKTILLQQL